MLLFTQFNSTSPDLFNCLADYRRLTSLKLAGLNIKILIKIGRFDGINLENKLDKAFNFAYNLK